MQVMVLHIYPGHLSQGTNSTLLAQLFCSVHAHAKGPPLPVAHFISAGFHHDSSIISTFKQSASKKNWNALSQLQTTSYSFCLETECKRGLLRFANLAVFLHPNY